MIQLIMVMSLLLVPAWSHAQTEYDFAFSYYIGGVGYEQIRDVTTDKDGNIYITGGTSSKDFIITQGTLSAKLNSEGQKIMDVFIIKLDSNGVLIWSTLLGGPEYDRAYAIEVDDSGYVFVAGRAGEGFPVTGPVFQPAFSGDTNENKLYGKQDGFVAKIAPDGTRTVWCSYFGEEDKGFIRDIALADNGDVYAIMTETSATCRFVTTGAVQPQINRGYDAVIAKIAGDGSVIKWATYLGGNSDDFIGPSIRVNRLQQVVVCGTTISTDMSVTQHAFDKTYNGSDDLYIAIVNADGTELLLGTYLGGSLADGSETHNLALDEEGNIIVAATTSSYDFPVTKDAYQMYYGGSGKEGTGLHTNYPYDGFIAKLSADGSRLLAATYIGGSKGEGLEGVALDKAGNIYCSGSTFSENIPTNKNSFQKSKSGRADQLVARFSSNLKHLEYCSYLGGENTDYGRSLHVDERGNIFIAGETSSLSFPSQNHFHGGSLDGVITRLNKK